MQAPYLVICVDFTLSFDAGEAALRSPQPLTRVARRQDAHSLGTPVALGHRRLRAFGDWPACVGSTDTENRRTTMEKAV